MEETTLVEVGGEVRIMAGSYILGIWRAELNYGFMEEYRDSNKDTSAPDGTRVNKRERRG